MDPQKNHFQRWITCNWGLCTPKPTLTNTEGSFHLQTHDQLSQKHLSGCVKKTLSAGTLGVSWGPSVKCCSNLQQTPPYFSFLKHFFRVAKFVTVMLRGALTRLRWRGGTGTWWLEEDPLHICQQLCSWTRCLSVPEFTSKAVEMNKRFQRLTDYHRV